MKKLIIIGASGHGKVIADIAKKNGYTDIAFLDDKDDIFQCNNYPVIGKTEDLKKYNSDFIVAIGNCTIRKKIQELLISYDKKIVTLIHPDAVVADGITIGIGSVIMAGVVVNPCSSIGDGCIINTCASVDHDCTISNYVHISVGAHVAGTVTIGEKTWLGAGAIVKNNISICSDCMIGVGAAVVKNIEESGTYIGVPARKVIN